MYPESVTDAPDLDGNAVAFKRRYSLSDGDVDRPEPSKRPKTVAGDVHVSPGPVRENGVPNEPVSVFNEEHVTKAVTAEGSKDPDPPPPRNFFKCR